MPICHHESDVNCSTPGCNAVKIGATHSVAHDDYFINCATMRKCYKCDLMFCDKHDWHWLRKKATHGFYSHEIVASCDACLPKYVAEG